MGIKLLSRLRLSLGHVSKHKFCHNFIGTATRYAEMAYYFATIILTSQLLSGFFLSIPGLQNFSDKNGMVCFSTGHPIRVVLELKYTQRFDRPLCDRSQWKITH